MQRLESAASVGDAEQCVLYEFAGARSADGVHELPRWKSALGGKAVMWLVRVERAGRINEELKLKHHSLVAQAAQSRGRRRAETNKTLYTANLQQCEASRMSGW